MTETLVIIFVKNIKLGTVKTRLAKTIGDHGAFEVYTQLVKLTEKATQNLSIDKRIYFSNDVEADLWSNEFKTVQKGKDLGERMYNAFKDGFEAGYKYVVLIGSDLPDISSETILKGVNALNTYPIVFGPAEDGGYYLIGLSKLIKSIFENKPWSQPKLLEYTTIELEKAGLKYELLETMNDIDTYEDLINSNLYKSNEKLQLKLNQLNA